MWGSGQPASAHRSVTATSAAEKLIEVTGFDVQVGDLHDESLIWLLPYQEVQKAGIRLSD